MKKASLALIISATLALSACGNDKKTEESTTAEGGVSSSKYVTEAQQQSYALGARMGSFARSQVLAQNELELEGDDAALTAGFVDAFNDKSEFSEQEVANLVKAYTERFSAAKHAKTQASSAIAIETGKAFLEENGKREGVITTESGLQYEILTDSEGASPKPDDKVEVHYHGTLLDGTVFDSSVERGQPTAFQLNRVIPGWTEGLQLMSVGSKYRFTIPSELAYGQRATGKITPNSTLIFDVELLGITPFAEE